MFTDMIFSCKGQALDVLYIQWEENVTVCLQIPVFSA